jgi:hypothetical protein
MRASRVLGLGPPLIGKPPHQNHTRGYAPLSARPASAHALETWPPARQRIATWAMVEPEAPWHFIGWSTKANSYTRFAGDFIYFRGGAIAFG